MRPSEWRGWIGRLYGNEHISIPVSVHLSATVSKFGTAPDGMRVINAAKLDTLKAAVIQMTTTLASVPGSWTDTSAISEELVRNKLVGNAIIPAYSVAAKAEVRHLAPRPRPTSGIGQVPR